MDFGLKQNGVVVGVTRGFWEFAQKLLVLDSFGIDVGKEKDGMELIEIFE